MYQFTNRQSEFANVNIDLRHELELLKGSFSIQVLYIRNCKFVRCDCFDDTEKTGNSKCPKCFGSGYFASIQKFNTIESSNSPYSGNNQINIKPIGATDQKDEVYYFDYTVLPRDRDYILKVTWKDGLPIDIAQVLEVVNVWEMRGDNGRVEVFGTGVKERPDKVETFNNLLHRLPKKAKKVISAGDKYIWPLNYLK